MEPDSRELVSNIEKDTLITKLEKTLSKYKFKNISSFFSIVLLVVVVILLYQQLSEQKIKEKMTSQYLFNINRNVELQNRRTTVINMIAKVALHYNPKFNERVLNRVATLIYETGELRYNIPAEEWVVLITYESWWFYKGKKSISFAGAKGLMQLMPGTAVIVSKVIDINYMGNVTLFNPIDNAKLGMRYYYILKKIYKKPEYYISAYNWGEGSIGKFFRKNKKLDKRHRKYFNNFLKIKVEVEKLIEKKIILGE